MIFAKIISSVIEWQKMAGCLLDSTSVKYLILYLLYFAHQDTGSNFHFGKSQSGLKCLQNITEQFVSKHQLAHKQLIKNQIN